jgi:hypothetical protein
MRDANSASSTTPTTSSRPHAARSAGSVGHRRGRRSNTLTEHEPETRHDANWLGPGAATAGAARCRWWDDRRLRRRNDLCRHTGWLAHGRAGVRSDRGLCLRGCDPLGRRPRQRHPRRAPLVGAARISGRTRLRDGREAPPVTGGRLGRGERGDHTGRGGRPERERLRRAGRIGGRCAERVGRRRGKRST